MSRLEMIQSAARSQRVIILSYDDANWAVIELKLSWALFCFQIMITMLIKEESERSSVDQYHTDKYNT